MFFIFVGFIMLAVAGYFVLSPYFFPNKIKGDLQDLTVIPSKGGKDLLWIQTDGSFSYISEKSSPGYHSVGRKGLFCKTWSYLYDPVEKKILKKIKTDYDELPPKAVLFYHKGNVWSVSGDNSDNEPAIHIYEPESGAEVLNTQGFVKKYPILSSGISKLFIDEAQRSFRIETKDGLKPVFSLDKDSLFEDQKHFFDSFLYDKENMTIFALGSESSGPRKKLYKLTGPVSELSSKTISESYLHDPKTTMFFLKSESVPMAPEKVFLEGIIIYQDKDGAVILHQDKADKNAERMLTCISNEGKERWTLNQSQLYSNMGVNDKDAFSVIFFMKSKFKGIREGNTFIFKFEPEGAIGIDYETGKKLWQLDI